MLAQFRPVSIHVRDAVLLENKHVWVFLDVKRRKYVHSDQWVIELISPDGTREQLQARLEKSAENFDSLIDFGDAPSHFQKFVAKCNHKHGQSLAHLAGIGRVQVSLHRLSDKWWPWPLRSNKAVLVATDRKLADIQ